MYTRCEPTSATGKVAYFTPEIFVNEHMMTGTGGLGTLALEYARESHQQGRRTVIVAPLPSFGTYVQMYGERRVGWRDQTWNYHDYLDLTSIETPISISGGGTLWVRSWTLKDKSRTCDIVFLDTDYEKNDEIGRFVTRFVYGGSRENGRNDERKIAYAMVLGIAGVDMLEKLGYDISLYHLNESHAVFAALRLLHPFLVEGMPLREAITRMRKYVVFTTHTPVAAGNWAFSTELVRRMLSCSAYDWPTLEAIGSTPQQPGQFNLTAAALRLARMTNAVSELHGRVARNMWANISDASPIISITNGVDDFWEGDRLKNATQMEEFYVQKASYQHELIEEIKHRVPDRVVKIPEPSPPFVVFARRFADYKRVWFFLKDKKWLHELLIRDQMVLIIAGKSYPGDDNMTRVWNELWDFASAVPNMYLIPNYDLTLMQHLKRAATIWLNFPRVPLEACGTSGMGAARINRALNISTIDGWMAEADPNSFMPFGVTEPCEGQDDLDFADFKRVLVRALDMYRRNRPEFFAITEKGSNDVIANFSAERMVNRYWADLYQPALDMQ